MDKKSKNISLSQRLLSNKSSYKRNDVGNVENLNNRRDFLELYSELYNKNKYYLENLKRREVKRNNKIVGLIFLFLVIISLIYIFNEVIFEIIAFLIIISMIPATIIILVLKIKRRNVLDKKVNFDKEFKERIIRPIIQNILPDSQIIFEYVLNSKIYDFCSHEDYDTYSSKNYIKSNIKVSEDIKYNTEIQICNIKTKKEVKSGEDTRLKTVFDGMLVTASLQKSFNGILRIYSNNTIYSGSKHKLEMDMNEFEQIFDIETDNNIVTMQWLTSDTMSKILMLLNKCNIYFELCIVDNMLIMRFFTKNEIDDLLVGSPLYLDRVKTYIKNLEKIIEITSYMVKSYNEVEF